MTIINTLPFDLQNGTLADATQVDANFNAIVDEVNANAAASGVNSDITQLTALEAPPGGLGAKVFTGPGLGGTANAWTLTSTSPGGFSLVAGNRVTAVVTAAPTGATTLNVNNTGILNVLKLAAGGLVNLIGGEYGVGDVVDLFYDGTQYQALNPVSTAFYNYVSEVRWFTAEFVPPLWLYSDGQAVSRTTYAALFTSIGTNYGAGDGSTTFNVPDLRGIAIRGWDNGRGLDPGRAFGSYQADAIIEHTHDAEGSLAFLLNAGPNKVNFGGTALAVDNSSLTTAGVTAGVATASETRMKNIALYPCIYAGV